jgi:hypothetical protein
MTLLRDVWRCALAILGPSLKILQEDVCLSVLTTPLERIIQGSVSRTALFGDPLLIIPPHSASLTVLKIHLLIIAL